MEKRHYSEPLPVDRASDPISKGEPRDPAGEAHFGHLFLTGNTSDLLLAEGDHHPDLPVQRHCPRCARDVAEACQPRQPYNIQSIEELRTDLIRPRGLATEELFDHLGNLKIEEVLEVFPPTDSQYP